MKKFSTEVHLSREMGLWDAALIGVGAMIGAGIFVLTGIAAGVAGPGLIITFSLNGLVALLTAFSYAELGLFFSAMALVEIDIAREIVFIGFAALLLTLSASVILVVAANRESLKHLFRRDRKNRP